MVPLGSITSILVLKFVVPILGLYHEPSMTVISYPIGSHRGSLLGFSMAYLNKHLFISAPKHGVGKLFDYDILKNTNLREISSPYEEGIYNDHYWLGAVVKTGSSFLVTCAPRSRKYWHPKDVIVRGSCYTFRRNKWKEMNDIPQYLINEYSNSGIDTSGWSIEVDPEDTVYIGSPAVSLGGTVKVYEDINVHPLVFENTTTTVNYGYSIASGYFMSENEISYAISSTYGHYGKGMVSIIDKLNNEIVRIYGTEVGASFGAALCKVHLNGRRSSLLVGSPTFSKSSNEYDSGAVYLYVPKNGTKDFILKRKIMGQTAGSNFGFAIISLGDMDGDEKDEVAIGAPYEDDLRGAVYIYSGFALLSGSTWLQRIQPEKYRSFGLSIVSLNNRFENGCNDLAVGAPFDERVFILKCNNYITVNISAVFPNLQTRADLTFFSFTTCIKVDLPKNKKKITSRIAISAELFHSDASLQKKDGTFIVALDSKELYCNNITVLTPPDGNYDTLISYKITASLNDIPTLKYSSSRILLSERSNLQIQGNLWAANCRSSTGKCIPKLHATLLSNISKPYIVGSTNGSFSLSVLNDGETAYAACMLVTVSGAHLLRHPYTCTRQEEHDRLMCKSSTPIHTDDIWEIGEIHIDTNSLTSKDENIKIIYILYNNCNNEDGKQEYERIFPLGYDTDIIVTSVSNPSDLVNLTSSDLAIEQPLEHFYLITNNGSTHWVDVTCEILLEKRNYLNYKVYILKERTEACIIMEGETNFTSTCEIGDLPQNQLVNVFVYVEVLPNSLGDIIRTQNVTITTQLAVLLRENRKLKSVTTVLMLISKAVPVWIPVVTSLLALIIILIIILILYKKKYFERKNKKELKNLRASIRANKERINKNNEEHPRNIDS